MNFNLVTLRKRDKFFQTINFIVISGNKDSRQRIKSNKEMTVKG